MDTSRTPSTRSPPSSALPARGKKKKKNCTAFIPFFIPTYSFPLPLFLFFLLTFHTRTAFSSASYLRQSPSVNAPRMLIARAPRGLQSCVRHASAPAQHINLLLLALHRRTNKRELVQHTGRVGAQGWRQTENNSRKKKRETRRKERQTDHAIQLCGDVCSK